MGLNSSARKHRPKVPKLVIFLNENIFEVLEIVNIDSGIRYHTTTLKSHKSKMLVEWVGEVGIAINEFRIIFY